MECLWPIFCGWKWEKKPNDAPCDGLSKVSYLDQFGGGGGGVGKWENLWNVRRASTHYVINAWLEKSGMLPNYAPWCGLEAYRRGVTMINYFWWKWKKLRMYMHRSSKPYIYLWSHFFWVNMPRGPAFREQYFLFYYTNRMSHTR